jgi:putative membrane protein
MKKIKHVAAIVLAVLGIVIALQNTTSVETQLLFATVTMPRAVLLFITLLIGFISGIFASMVFSKKWIIQKKT